LGLVKIRDDKQKHARTHAHTHTQFNSPLSRTTRESQYHKGKPIWILLKQETVSGSGISWAICKSAPCSRQITMPAHHDSSFYRPDALPAAQPTASKHQRQKLSRNVQTISLLYRPPCTSAFACSFWPAGLCSLWPHGFFGAFSSISQINVRQVGVIHQLLTAHRTNSFVAQLYEQLSKCRSVI